MEIEYHRHFAVQGESNHHNNKPRNKLKDGPQQEWVSGEEPLVHATFVLHIG